ncbi:MAG TPA: 4'-phosphopantetheinyl transferase superfamily protein [Flavisolibacter sp.]|nr:4'-phosphopantetheinyl transferase superfamily protein [Flavisolibacter sp.]
MPIFFQQDIDESTRLAIWKIEEEEAFFLAQVPLQRDITHPHKRLQHLAGRYLLAYLFADFPLELIQIADTRKPYLENEAYHFSISHCSDFAAAIASKENRVGIDIEMATEKVNRIRHKFISEEENKIINAQFSKSHIRSANGKDAGASSRPCNPAIGSATLIWSCKEAAFKWYGLGGVDFKEHMIIQSIIANGEKSFETIMRFKKKEELFLSISSLFFDELCLSYVVT